MGSCAELKIGSTSFFEMTFDIADAIMTIFDEGDKKVLLSDDEDVQGVCEYRISSVHAASRLDVLGFTAERARAIYNQHIRDCIDEIENEGIVLWLRQMDGREVDFLDGFTYERWGETIREYVKTPSEQQYGLMDNPDISDELRVVSNFMYREELFYGFPFCDLRLFVRAILDVLDSEVDVVVDLIDLVFAGYYQGDEKLAESARNSIRDGFVASAKVIILTEGSTDSEFLQKAMQKLYCELLPLYSFIDFRLPNMEGGAANLVRIVKGFVGSGISNRVIALFDNDTAAKEAVRKLDGVDLPGHMKILHYPSLELAKDYPTIGPAGLFRMDVNGLAGSIEMYFGSDVLERANRELCPVQWKGFNQSLQQYQGELVSKSELQKRFREKVKSSEPNLDWSGMEAILKMIFNAFDNSASANIES